MKYNFHDIIDNIDETFDDFINKYTTNIHLCSDEYTEKINECYLSIFKTLNTTFDDEDIINKFKELTKQKISLETPYGIMVNEIYWLKNILITHVLEKNMTSNIITILQLFKDITNSVAHLYLLEYLERLISINNVRRSSLSDLTEKNLIIHYEVHLIWLTKLAEHIKTKDKTKFPELNHTLCDFGKWLHGDGKKIIKNNSKYKALYNIHEKLHLFAQKIYDIIEDGEYNILITYLEKCELISLGIGTELSLLDQIIINKRITKDSLTGALSRNALKDLFESQYELALATNNPFILAMCDLDFFKDVNDTYGHVAGDKMLKLFVQTVQKNIRNSDMIIRYGGEEFVIILPIVNKKNGYKILEKIRQEFEEAELSFNKQTIKATVSMGMMEIQPEKLFKKKFTDEYVMIVDKNLYIAKDAGRNRIEVY
ncbi:MAG: sensor domain-containing diguanylate cyclase [Sulfurimonas sp.]